jgi:CHAD domain-containing protein
MAKWIPDVSPTDRAVDVAARSLGTRLDAVRRYLKRSVKKPDDPENVHQLRVWTRRSDAAVKLYAELLPKKRARWLRRTLRRIRRAAGGVRDVDVFAKRTVAPGKDWPRNLRDERRRAQRKLDRLYAGLDRGRKLNRRTQKLLDRLRQRNATRSEIFVDRARQTLRPLVAAFFESSPIAAAGEAELHRFRIAGKNLRYAVELLAGAFPPDFRLDIYPTLTILQERLGLINDLAVARNRLRKRKNRTGDPAELSELRRRLNDAEAELIEARSAFDQWWTPETRDSLRRRLTEFVIPTNQD